MLVRDGTGDWAAAGIQKYAVGGTKVTVKTNNGSIATFDIEQAKLFRTFLSRAIRQVETEEAVGK